MANLFVNIPCPAAVATGVAVPLFVRSSLTFVSRGTFVAHCIIEGSIDGGVTFTPVFVFNRPGVIFTLPITLGEARCRTSVFVSGAPFLEIGGKPS